MNQFYLCNFDSQDINFDNSSLLRLWSGSWLQINQALCNEILQSNFENEQVNLILKECLKDINRQEDFIELAISTALMFTKLNWDTHPEVFKLDEYLGLQWPENIVVSERLQKDSETIYVNMKNPELLYMSLNMFETLCQIQPNLVHLWWNFRTKVLHQRSLEDTSATLYSELELIIAKLSNHIQSSDGILSDKRVKILLLTEIAQAYLLYGRIQKVEEYLLKAKEMAGLKLELTGVLGKRTKFQQKALPQLALSSELDSSIERPTAEDSHGSSELPQNIELQDDVRLNKISYDKTISQADLPSLEQTLCLLTVQYLLKAQPKDELLNEELQPYIDAVLTQKKGPWSTRVAALLIRCKLEANHKRTVERAMMQSETVVNDKTKVSDTSRLSYLWASGLNPAWTWKQQLADLYLSLGLVKAALELYEKLHLWEDVIVCYTMLQLRHKAAEVIQQQIDIEPTVKLYCLLGDATDDISCYEKAWEFSNCKSSRAQRHWGNFLFNHKKYGECIPHFEKSVEINSIQERVWLRLGYAALMEEKWDIAATAYRRYTYLQPNSFEAWNNLAKVYVNQGDKPRAYRALIESLRFNYDNWKLWENVILISMDTVHLEDVIRGVHRLLDLQQKYDDVEVLTLLVTAVVQDIKDADGNGAGRLRKRVLELFGRVTSVHQNKPELWQLYADVSPTYLQKAQRLLKAYKGYTMNGNWSNSPDSCKKVIELVLNMLEYSLKARQEADDKDKLQPDQQLSSARLTGQAVIRAAEKQKWDETNEVLKQLDEAFKNVTEYMKSVL